MPPAITGSFTWGELAGVALGGGRFDELPMKLPEALRSIHG